MKILAIERERPGTQPEDFQPHLTAEARSLWALYTHGIVREAHFRVERSEAVLVLECPSPEEARAALATLPLVRAQLIDFELIPLRPYPGFERLFQEPDEPSPNP